MKLHDRKVIFHPVAEMFPLIEGPAFETFCEDIKVNKQSLPILYVDGPKGEIAIVDGRNRYRACIVNGFRPRFQKWDGKGSLAAKAASLNFARRHLTPSQKAAAAVAIKRQFAIEAGVKMNSGKKTAGDPVEKVAQGQRAPTSRERAAKLCDVNERYVDQAEKLADHSPTVFADVVNGKINLNQATRVVKRSAKSAMATKMAKSLPPLDATACDIRAVDVLAGFETVPTGSVRLIFADPPYNCGIDYGRGPKKDQRPVKEFAEWLAAWMIEANRVLAPDGSIFVMMSGEYSDIVGQLLSTRFHRRNCIVWHETFGTYTDDNFTSCARFVHYYTRDWQRFVFNGEAIRVPSDRLMKYGDKRADASGKVPGNVWQFPRLVDNAAERVPGFPTQIPRAIVDRIVLAASEPRDLVCDPFTGSGTTAESAILHGRRFVGFDINPKYVASAVKRVQLAVAKGGAF